MQRFKTTLNNIAEIKPILESEKKPGIIITTHHKPDADALGSSLGLYHILCGLGLTPEVISPTDYGNFLKWLPGEKQVINFEEYTSDCIQKIEQADLIFCLDFNALKRINKMGDYVAASKAKKVLIDHHLEPEGFEDFRLWSTKASSTSELIYWFVELLGYEHLVNADIASCLYAGIMTDTASFKHNSTTPTTHRVVANLLEHAIRPSIIHEEIYDNYSENRTRFIGYCLDKKLQLFPEFATAIITVSEEELKLYGIITGDTEGLVNYGLTIGGVVFSILIVDRSIIRKMSFRSKGNFPANEFARTYFNGGGHFNAAGGESNDSLQETEARCIRALSDYKEKLINTNTHA